MPDEPKLLIAAPPPPSPARTQPPARRPLRVGLVQERWHPDPEEHRGALARGIRTAAAEGARLVCLQELTLSPYFAVTADGPAAAGVVPEELEVGATATFARRVAAETGVYVHASLYERDDAATDGGAGGRGSAQRSSGSESLGYNTAIVVAPDGRIV